ncbi:uncharacterized protein LOC106162942 [Lingula anatina]|uniref:Uncharacterized protein LOC106162942 n=1 Tax=Lingula anatina TaxID=7574 RepID=A0A1S3IC56_LINAN|nr:uncharacterized protein LOC106162942 [Lingula anatina]|eukprot:XP_013395840.1 uncharacterized protein LOC106162942 [Lingula anatina]
MVRKQANDPRQTKKISEGTSGEEKDAPSDGAGDAKPKPAKDGKKKKKENKEGNVMQADTKTFRSTLVGSLKYILLIIILPPFLNYTALVREGSYLKPEVGELYDIGFGQKMYLGCMGSGSPTVILDAPTGMTSDVWSLVLPLIAKETRVCVYDRAGLGYSDRPYKNYSKEEGDKADDQKNLRDRWQEFTLERMIDDLHRLLSLASQQPKPLILVGSELGGLIARGYTQLYENEVAHVVLVDPLVEDLFQQDEGVWAQFWFGQLIPSYQSLQLTAAMGLTRLALLTGYMEQPINSQLVSEEVVKRQKYVLCHPRHLSSVVDEHFFINDTFSQIKTLYLLKPFPQNVSVTVITGNYYDEQLPSSLNKAWAKSQENLISRLHPGCKHIVINGADHKKLYTAHLAVVDPVLRLVRQWKTKHKVHQA